MPGPPYALSRVEISIPKKSSDNLYWGRYPQGDKPGGLSAVATAVATALGTLTTGSGPPPTGTRRWAPGHWAESDTVIFGQGSVATVQAEAASVTVALDRIPGMLILISWGAVEPTQGDISQGISLVDQVVASLPSVKNFMILVEVGAFTKTHPGGPSATLDPSIVPAYIQNDPANGQAAWRITFTRFTAAPAQNATSATLASTWDNPSGTHNITFNNGDVKAATFTANSKLVVWSGGLTSNTTSVQVGVAAFTTQATGRYGWYGGDGNGHTYAACLWRPAIMAAYTNACKLLMAHYAPNPRFHGMVMGENSFFIGAGTSNGVGGYSDAAMTAQQQSWSLGVQAAGPQCNVIFENTFMFAAGPCQDFENWMIDNAIAPGCSDSFGLTYSNAHGGAPFNWGLQAMCGFKVGTPVTPIRDRRAECRSMQEIQATDMGFFGQNSYSPQDILNGLNQVTRAAYAFWAIVPNSITGSQSPQANWPQLSAFLNNPANALLNTSYPPNYPT